MYPELQKELETFERRTPKSAEAHKTQSETHSARRRQQLPRLRSLSDFCERRAGQHSSATSTATNTSITTFASAR